VRLPLYLFTAAWLAAGSLWASAQSNTSADASENPRVALETDLGTLVLQLYPAQAPETVKNFLNLVERDYYDGVIFHRVIPGFVAQAGGYTFDFQQKPAQDTVVNESANGLNNRRSTVAMARRSDPDSASAQFFINLSDNENLDATENRPGYTVFGEVIEGYEVAQAIAEEPRGQYRSFPDAPNTPVRILDAKVVLEDKVVKGEAAAVEADEAAE
jgi:peptidyl-prolyl cis-trans isomerase A (cyclophilin A)